LCPSFRNRIFKFPSSLCSFSLVRICPQQVRLSIRFKLLYTLSVRLQQDAREQLKSNGINFSETTQKTNCETNDFLSKEKFTSSVEEESLQEDTEPPRIQIARGLEKQVLKPGDGKTFPKKGETVEVHYTGHVCLSWCGFGHQ